MSDLHWQFKLEGNTWAIEQLSIATKEHPKWQILKEKHEWWLRLPEPYPTDSVRLDD